ncbi:cuticle protein 16.5-like [Aethina tumida]|uniref:cuticle protein 16.5-like n=1 Tax=Aethina tumida TaxID=116153 RepID=UPI00096B4B64|nr:cuticle protein 16.5-like [Aethina tumida]
MFKFFALVFAAVLAVVSAGPKPGLVAAAYSAPVVAGAPVVAAAPAVAYSAPVAYSGYSSGYVAAPAVAAPLAYSAYSAPLAATYY